MSKIIKMGLDVHGVIDEDPIFFAEFTNALISAGHEVHILTGRELCKELIEKLRGFSVSYSQIFSITSYHMGIGTHISYKDGDPTQPLISPPKWNSTKAEYAKMVGLGVHLDDSLVYGQYFNGTTQYILYTPVIKTILTLPGVRTQLEG